VSVLRNVPLPGLRNRGAAERLPVLLVGYGARGRAWDSELRRHGSLFVAGAVDPSPDARSAASGRGLPAWESLEEALAEAAAAVALIASPPGEHAEQALACLGSGAAVLVEKPLALTTETAAAVARRAAEAGRPALVAQNFRFIDRERSVTRALAEGRLGDLLGGDVLSARPEVAAAHLRELEHGPLWDIALHHLDALRGRFGAPLGVAAEAREIPFGPTSYLLRLEFPGGVEIVYRHDERAPAFHHHEWLHGTKGALVVDGERVTALSAGRRVRPGRAPSPEQAVLAELVRALTEGGPSSLAAEENLPTVATVEAAVRSLQLGRPVALAELSAAPAGVDA
jgi:predicted dehydrogenase